MNDDFSVPVYVVIDGTMRVLGHRSHGLAQISDAEVLTVAVVAAKYFQNHHERALQVLGGRGYLSGRPSASRFNRRRHALTDWLRLVLETRGALFARGEAFLLDSMPVPVCRRARARRCRTVRGKPFCGYCAAKRGRFFGWRLHLVCTPAGVPVAFALLPGSLHDLTPVHELTSGLPTGAAADADKAYDAAADEATSRADMRPNRWADKLALRAHRKRIETLYSQLEALGIQRRQARTTPGLELTVHAALLAALVTNAD